MDAMTRERIDEAVMAQLDRHPDCLASAEKWDSHGDRPFGSGQAYLYLSDGKQVFLRHYRSTRTEQAFCRMASTFLAHGFTDREADALYESGMLASLARQNGNEQGAAVFASRVTELCRRHGVSPDHEAGLLRDCAVVCRCREVGGGQRHV